MSDFKKQVDAYLSTINNPQKKDLEKALSLAVLGEIKDCEGSFSGRNSEDKKAYYFSAEFLIGKSIFNNLLNIGKLKEAREVVGKWGLCIDSLEETDDAALGNGGLGRLAACFLDSAATLKLPLMGYGIRYKYGLFKQKCENGFQKEVVDDWTRFDDTSSIRKDKECVTVEFSDFTTLAVPYDIPIIGYGGEYVTTLRLWQSEAPKPFDFHLFNEQRYEKALKLKNDCENISRLLYPNDSTDKGKLLRLRQQYFFCSASLKDILRRIKKEGINPQRLGEYISIQLNDTHPVIAIPELIRLLLEEGMEFSNALDICRKVFSYTNHTVMPEALESWDLSLIGKISPEIRKIIKKIALLQKKELGEKCNDNCAIIVGKRVNMAYLASYCAKNINGVARLHTEILKSRVLKEFYKAYPHKFQNKTNGVTQRRWLALCNPQLSALITKLLKTDKWIKDYRLFQNLKPFAELSDVLDSFMKIKENNKERLSDYIYLRYGKTLNPKWIVDAQIKRIHEYKRQLLNILAILELYFEIKEGALKDFYPTTFIFSGKAAPGYMRAKAVIKLINEVARLIENDETVKNHIKVLFLPDYNVSLAERIIPAADVSEQISTAGTEASGTGNMKLMMNGAVTLGTLDGANIEIVDAAGAENNYIFGFKENEIEAARDSYSPRSLYENDYKIKRCLNALIDGTLSDGSSGYFKELYTSLLDGASWHKPDHYFLLLDFESYLEAKKQLNTDYKNRKEFSKKCWLNIAASGIFSSDRTIEEYAKDIWDIK